VTYLKQAQSSLIVRLPNWVGDVVMALPALQAMQQLGIELLLYGKPWAKDLLAGTDMTFVPISNTFWETTKKMAKMVEHDKVLLLTNSFSSALMGRLARKNTIGYKADNRQLLLKASLSKQPDLHEVEYFWNIARFASRYWFPTLTWPEKIPDKIQLPVSAASAANAKQVLKTMNINKPFWVLCPFAHGKGKKGQSKRWPHWRELSAKLHQYQLVVCPGKNDEALCAELVPEATVLAGLNLGDYAAVLASAEKVIANDSGPMHIAAAVGADTVGIFGATEPRRTRPWGANYVGSLGQWPDLAELI